MAKDLNQHPFDEATLDKLELFKLYLEEWLPVFIMTLKNRTIKQLKIVDFFAGSGADSNGVHGSPLIILEVIEKYKNLIATHQIKIKVIVNEFENEKFDKLSDVLDAHNKDKGINIVKYNKDFSVLFDELEEELRDGNNLIFLDQYGIKHVTTGKFVKLCNFERTDFMFFISSSFIKRFLSKEEFQKYLGWMKTKSFDDIPAHDVHRVIANEYRGLKGAGYVIPFTLKKENSPNVNGLIFCSQHVKGAEKFLDAAWKVNPQNGNANFDIEDDDSKKQIHLWERQLTKKEKFQSDLEKFIAHKKEATNCEVYHFTIESGFRVPDANSALKDLKKSGSIEDYKASYLSFSDWHKDKKIVTFRKKG